MVKEKSHASKHAKEPNHMTRSSFGGKRRKFSRRSSFVRVDSYGNSVREDECIYNGDGFSDDSSSCRCSGKEGGGTGRALGTGDSSGLDVLRRHPGSSRERGGGIDPEPLAILEEEEWALSTVFCADLLFGGGVETVRGANGGLAVGSRTLGERLRGVGVATASAMLSSRAWRDTKVLPMLAVSIAWLC